MKYDGTVRFISLRVEMNGNIRNGNWKNNYQINLYIYSECFTRTENIICNGSAHEKMLKIAFPQELYNYYVRTW